MFKRGRERFEICQTFEVKQFENCRKTVGEASADDDRQIHRVLFTASLPTNSDRRRMGIRRSIENVEKNNKNPNVEIKEEKKKNSGTDLKTDRKKNDVNDTEFVLG